MEDLQNINAGWLILKNVPSSMLVNFWIPFIGGKKGGYLNGDELCLGNNQSGNNRPRFKHRFAYCALCSGEIIVVEGRLMIVLLQRHKRNALIMRTMDVF